MGLQMNIELDSGIQVLGAYARIDSIIGSKQLLDVNLKYYVNQNAFLNGKSYIKQEVYSFTPSVEEGAPNFIKQGYEYLKTLPAFSDAVDVLD